MYTGYRRKLGERSFNELQYFLRSVHLKYRDTGMGIQMLSFLFILCAKLILQDCLSLQKTYLHTISGLCTKIRFVRAVLHKRHPSYPTLQYLSLK